MADTAKPSPRSAVIPSDEEAERNTVGLMVRSATTSRMAGGLLVSECFYRPDLGRAFEAAVQLPNVSGLERRLSIVSECSGVSITELEALERDSFLPVERWFYRVRIAARRRRLMNLAAALYNEAATLDLVSLQALGDKITEEILGIQTDLEALSRSRQAGQQ